MKGFNNAGPGSGCSRSVWAAYCFARAAFRLVLLLHAGVGAFVLASFVTGTPVIVVLLCWTGTRGAASRASRSTLPAAVVVRKP